jgi:hypothetical protein
MSPLRTAVAAGAAFILGWAAHEGLARVGAHPEATAMTPYQAAQALRSEEERKAREKAGGDGSVIVPLNVRDPSALVMGLPPSTEAGCVERPAPKCDCAAEKLKKTGRDVPERF